MQAPEAYVYIVYQCPIMLKCISSEFFDLNFIEHPDAEITHTVHIQKGCFY